MNSFIVRGIIFDFTDIEKNETSIIPRFIQDGALKIKNGYIADRGDFQEIQNKNNDLSIIDYSGKIICPGFIDTHIHYPQIGIIGSYGKDLLNWLSDYTFPAEERFQDMDTAYRMSRFFFQEAINNGTTTCLTYGTSSIESVDAFFEIALEENFRVIAGQVLMNRYGPKPLLKDSKTFYKESQVLIEKWNGKGRLGFALTPRFAISCDMNLLNTAGELAEEYPDVLIQTHLSENLKEIDETNRLFPEYKDYLNVYEEAGLLNTRTVLAHCIWVSDSELDRIKKSGASIAHCPTSNLFLGSGLLSFQGIKKRDIPYSIASDVGAGTSFSLLKNMGAAYQVRRLNGDNLSPYEAFYSVTLGAAKCLKLNNKIGNFDIGKEADFIVLDYQTPGIMKIKDDFYRNYHSFSLENALFSLMILGDDRNVESVFVFGERKK